MKTNNVFGKLACLFVFSALVACSEDAIVENIDGNGILQRVSITGKDFQFDDATRSSVSITENGASFLWDEDDVIGIFPNEGDQVSFAMSQGAGTQTATFSGGGWALKSSATYAAYYPHVYENRDMTKIPVSYVGQTQNGNNNTDHIGAYDFMAASVSTPSNGTVAFDMQHLGALVQLKIAVPSTGTLSSVMLSSDEDIFVEKGHVDLTATTPTIVSTQMASSFNIDLKNVSTTSANEIVTIYFMMPPADMTGKRLTVKVGKTVGVVDAKNFEKGKAYQLVAKLPTAIDLGLSVKWASCNVGATSPEEYGDYFAWGDTNTKSEFYENNCKTYGKDIVQLISYGFVNRDVLKAQYDAATIIWGNNWRMPTKVEMQELVTKCTWTWTTQNGVNGCLITGSNGNSIFLPAAGYRCFDLSTIYPERCGYYWTSSVYDETVNEDKSYSVVFGWDNYNQSAYYYRTGDNRSYGLTIRPVQE